MNGESAAISDFSSPKGMVGGLASFNPRLSRRSLTCAASLKGAPLQRSARDLYDWNSAPD
jgi:hypothetical protein